MMFFGHRCRLVKRVPGPWSSGFPARYDPETMPDHDDATVFRTPVVRMFKPLNTASLQPICGENVPTVLQHVWGPEHDTADRWSWLALQNAAFSRKRPWNELDFRRELADRDWFASSLSFRTEWADDSRVWSGAVTLELPADAGQENGRIHWLAVDPSNQRQGIGRRLVSACERACWEHGVTAIELETLRSWQSAIGFYQSLGYSEWVAEDRSG